jgi:adenylate cyclase
MPRLVATGKDPRDRWEHELTGEPVTVGRLGSESNWVTAWDNLISRKHATLTWREGELYVRKEPNARNPIIFHGRQVDEFSVSVGEQFFIGETTFSVREDMGTICGELPAPASEVSLDSDELRLVRFSDADERIEVLADLPGVIRNAPSDEDLEMKVIEVLLRGMPRAESAAVVCVGPGTEAAGAETRVRQAKNRGGPGMPLRPSSRLLVDSVLKRRQTVLHMWQPGELRTDLSANRGLEWAVCAPLPDDPSPGWALYVAGRFEGNRQIPEQDRYEDLLKADMKFAGLVADVFGSLRQVLHLQRREAKLSIFLPEPVRAALADQDIDEVLAPREADVTVLFCDLRGSCRIADDGQDDLAGLWGRISEALGIMTSSIIAQGGVIGDFEGDAAMGFWGWPLAFGDQSERAARAALVIRRRFAQAAQQKGHALAGFTCGIGIASGRAIAGRLGTFDQAKVSVYGPRVNLASRLESMTKLFQVPILIDDLTAEALAASPNVTWARRRRLARVLPFGMRQSLVVSELLPPAVEPGAMPERDRRDYEAAFDAFVSGSWDDARALLQRLPRDGASEFLKKFMERHQNIAPTGWDGAIILDAK